MSQNNLTILYGSQTGTAEDLAKRISWAAKRRHLSINLSTLDNYSFPNLINERCILFICSTMGQGEEPDNMKLFWKLLLRKTLPTNSLSQTHFAVIALGDSSYSKFNFVAKRLNKRLQQLGAVPIMDLALGDDQHELGPDAAIDPWMVQFWENLRAIFPDELSQKPLNDDVLLPSLYNAVIHNDKTETTQRFAMDLTLVKSPVISNKRETSESHFQDVRLLKCDIKNESLSYNCGDVAIIQPVNLRENVEAFYKLFHISPNKIVSVKSRNPNVPLPKCLEKNCTVDDLVKKYFDIQSVPKRSFFEILRYFSRSDLEKEKLNEFCTPQGQEDLYSYCNRPRRTIIEILDDFPETTPFIPFEYLFDLLPPIRPRYFTIASSPLVYPGEIHILVAVVRYYTRLRQPRRGLCSTYMSNLQVGERIDVGVKRGTFIWPPEDTATILIGPGTGCAPFRAFAQDRSRRGMKKNMVFLGFRNQKGDFLCRHEWAAFQTMGDVSLFVAFSRDQDDKIYVQHKLLEQANVIWELLQNQQGCIYVAGNAKQMPQDVQSSLCQIFTKIGGLNEMESESFLKNLEKQKRLQFEVWA